MLVIELNSEKKACKKQVPSKLLVLETTFILNGFIILNLWINRMIELKHSMKFIKRLSKQQF